MASSTIDDQLKSLIETGQIAPAKTAKAAPAKEHTPKPKPVAVKTVKAVKTPAVAAEEDDDEQEAVGVDQPDDDVESEAVEEVEAVTTGDGTDDADDADDADEEDEEEAVEAADGQQDLVLVYSDRCMKCAHLCGMATRYYDDCHFSTGNEDCPAAKLRIIVGINFEKASDALAQAMMENNVERLSRINAKLADKDELVQKRVFQMARDKIVKASA